jgi:hypothetical protein
MHRKWKIVVLAASVFALSAARIFAARVEVGDKAPAWSGIPGTDDKNTAWWTTRPLRPLCLSSLATIAP